MGLRLAALVCACVVLLGNGCGQGDSSDEVLDNLGIVSSAFSPNSLSYEAARTGPCGSLDLFECQPVLLRLYIDFAKRMFDTTRDIIAVVKPGLDNQADGSSGTDVTVENGYTADYVKTSSTDMELIIKKNGTSVVYLGIDGTTYSLKADLSQLTGGQDSGGLQVDIEFTDATHWSLVALITGRTCDDADFRAPEAIRVRNTRDGDIWKGGAQMDNGRFLNGIVNGFATNCSTTEDDSTSLDFYTQYVADNTAAKANVYTVQRDEADFSNFSSLPLSEFCNAYLSGDCSNYPTTSYPNSFCNPDSTDVALWNDDCSALSSTVASTAFPDLADPNFTPPQTFSQQAVTVPSSL